MSQSNRYIFGTTLTILYLKRPPEPKPTMMILPLSSLFLRQIDISSVSVMADNAKTHSGLPHSLSLQSEKKQRPSSNPPRRRRRSRSISLASTSTSSSTDGASSFSSKDSWGSIVSSKNSSSSSSRSASQRSSGLKARRRSSMSAVQTSSFSPSCRHDWSQSSPSSSATRHRSLSPDGYLLNGSSRWKMTDSPKSLDSILSSPARSPSLARDRAPSACPRPMPSTDSLERLMKQEQKKKKEKKASSSKGDKVSKSGELKKYTNSSLKKSPSQLAARSA